jgi:hypothetical protein
MSRSRKKNQYLKYGGVGTPKWAKRQANKAVRRYVKQNLDNIPLKGHWYRKVTNPWDIYDVVSYCPRKDFPDFSRYKWEDGYSWHRSYFWK